MRVSGFIFLTILFLILSSIDMQVNLFLIDFFIVSNFTYLFLCYLCFVNPQKINSLFAAYIGFFIDPIFLSKGKLFISAEAIFIAGIKAANQSILSISNGVERKSILIFLQ